ncbi:c-type cytochrome [Massilia sp. CMS3.1]|uniref:c-type cytochrome n=1 Tax=Massilia sp. CMS3.1 TaxID=3373083 RepID=UPI003EE80465
MKKLLAVLVLAASAGSAFSAEVVGNPKAAQSKIEMCIGCHGIPGYKASFPEVYPVPMIGGQSAKYIESALHAYKKGDRKHPSMRGIAVSLSDQDIADVAAYYSQQNAQSRK